MQSANHELEGISTEYVGDKFQEHIDNYTHGGGGVNGVNYSMGSTEFCDVQKEGNASNSISVTKTPSSSALTLVIGYISVGTNSLDTDNAHLEWSISVGGQRYLEGWQGSKGDTDIPHTQSFCIPMIPPNTSVTIYVENTTEKGTYGVKARIFTYK